jgi:hypothetical protein
MDALARIEPVARPLLLAVDEALTSLGAPAEHPIWPLLRGLTATPADAVAHVADSIPDRAAGERLRAEADRYEGLAVPTAIDWAGAAGEAYAVRAASLAQYGHATLAGALRATASFVDAVADWHGRSRDRVAGAVADALGSLQAVTLRTGEGQVRIVAAADIGAHVLSAAAEVLAEGERLRDDWAGRLDGVLYQPPTEEGARSEGRIRLTY